MIVGTLAGGAFATSGALGEANYSFAAGAGDAAWVDSLPFKLPASEDQIFDFVAHSIRFHAYAGSLRGPRGVALGRAGNSIDKALLLETLLRETGATVRLVRGPLAPDEAGQLIDHYFADLSAERRELLSIGSYDPPPPDTPTEFIDAVLAERAERLALLERLAIASEAALLSAMPDIGGTDDDNAARLRDKMLAEVRDHVWVQVERANGTWFDLDPTFPGLAPGEKVSATPEVFAAVPPELTHSLTIHIDAEYRQGDETRTLPRLSLMTTSTALYGIPVTLVHPLEDDWLYPAGGYGESVSIAIDVLGGTVRGGLPYRPELRIADQVFTGDFLIIEGWKESGLFDRPPPPEIVREEICFDLTGPGYSERRCRTIFDRRIPPNGELSPFAVDDEGKIRAPAALGGFYSFAIASGAFPDEVVTSAVGAVLPSDAFDDDEPLDPQFAEYEIDETLPNDADQMTRALGAVAQSAYLQDRKMRAFWRDGEAWGSIATPNIYSFYIAVAEGSGEAQFGARTLDFIRQDVRIPQMGQLWKEAPTDTAIETTILAFLDGLSLGSTADLVSAPLVIEDTAAAEKGISRIDQSSDLDAIGLPAPHRTLLEARLEAAIVLVPRQQPDGYLAWLEVDRTTHQTTDGVISTIFWPGAGNQANTEYIAEQRGIMRIARTFCKLVQCLGSTFKLAVAGVRVWGRASFEYAKETYDSVRGVVSDCKNVKLRLRVPREYRGANYRPYLNNKQGRFNAEPHNTPSRADYERDRKQSPGSLMGGPAGSGRDWDHTVELACGGKHARDNIAAMPSDLNRWFGATLGAMCGMLCEGTKITGLELIFVP